MIKFKTVKNKIIISGPRINPFKPKTFNPPKIEKKITKGCRLILSFKKNGLKKLSKKLIQKPEIKRKKIPLTRDSVAQITIPTGSQTIAAPKIGMKVANINNTAKKREPSTPKHKNIINAASP
jgi:hypothetical protein